MWPAVPAFPAKLRPRNPVTERGCPGVGHRLSVVACKTLILSRCNTSHQPNLSLGFEYVLTDLTDFLFLRLSNGWPVWLVGWSGLVSWLVVCIRVMPVKSYFALLCIPGTEDNIQCILSNGYFMKCQISTKPHSTVQQSRTVLQAGMMLSDPAVPTTPVSPWQLK